MTTLVVYPDADPESSTIDGHVRRSGVDQTWANIRSGAGTNQSSTSASQAMAQLTASTTSSQFERLVRGIMLFDTSSIGAGDTVSSATLSLYGSAKGAGLGSTGLDLDIVTSTPASNTALASSDYANLGGTPLASLAYGSFSTAAYNDFSLGTGDVTKAGITKLGCRLSWDVDDSFGGSWSSGASTYFSFHNADQTGTTNDPKLTVVYTVGAVSVNADVVDGAMTVLEPAGLRDWNVAPGVLDGSMTVLEPAALRDWNVAPDVLDGSMTVLDPPFGLVVNADLLDGSMTVMEPAALRDWNVGPDVLDGALTVLAPSLPSIVYADVLDGALTVLEAAGLQDWNVAGDVLDAALAVWDASVSVGGLTTYGWILGSYQLMQDAHKIELLGEMDGMAGRRGGDLVVSGQEGRVWREKWHDGRVIALRMWMRGDTRAAYQAGIDALLAALGRSEVQTLRRGMADGTERQIEVRLNQALVFQPQSERFARMVVEFTAAAPYWRQADSTVVVLAAGSLPYGFACNNGGSAADDAPVVTITPTGGTLTNPRLTIGSTWVQYTGTVTTGVTLTIDCGAWTATKGAASVAANMSSAKADWLVIPAGSNTATLSGTLSAGTVAGSVTFYRRWH